MIVLIWVICGVFAAVIASSKGRSAGGWLVLGLLFGIFGLILVACLPSLKVSQPTVVYVDETGKPTGAVQSPRYGEEDPEQIDWQDDKVQLIVLAALIGGFTIFAINVL